MPRWLRPTTWEEEEGEEGAGVCASTTLSALHMATDAALLAQADDLLLEVWGERAGEEGGGRENGLGQQCSFTLFSHAVLPSRPYPVPAGLCQK